jgi:chromosome segregation ATPase
MTNDSEIGFEASSGISEEEQRDILAHINGIAEKNRLSLSGGGSPDGDNKRQRFTAKKSGGLFPILVNAAAIAALVGGFLLLSSFQGKTDAEAREGIMVYNSAERALIEEIRKETSSRLEVKEREIALITSKLASIDAELHGLYLNNEELDEYQQASGDQLRALQEEYLATLAQLQDERSRILEESRTREASLQMQLENRTRELALVAQQSAAAIDLARNEMARLSVEQTQDTAVEAQMGAFFVNLNTQITENRLDDAAATVRSMRNFLNTPAFQSLRSIQARRELYTQAINSFETIIETARRNPAAIIEPTGAIADTPDENIEKFITELQDKNTRLEQNLAEKDKTIESLNSGGSGMTQRITELEGSVTALRTMSAALEASSNEKTTRIQSLENENATLNQTVNARATTITRLENENTTLNQTVNARTNTITRIQDVVQGKAISDMTIGELSQSLVRIQEALQGVR